MSKTPIGLYWWGHHEDKPNFGDLLSPLIVQAMSGRDVAWRQIADADMISTGSLLQRIPGKLKNPRTEPLHVWGTGLMFPTRLSSAFDLEVHAVRGPLTYAAFEADVVHGKGLTQGDPGLLVHRLLDGAPVPKQHRLGVVPHHSQLRMAEFGAIIEQNDGAAMIDLRNPDALAVLRAIAACETIVSSSLHGLIVADALGIPNLWVEPRGLHRGGRFKFFDYFLSVRRAEFEPVRMDGRTVEAVLAGKSFDYFRSVRERRDALEESFPDLG
jgi:hypothetical protein